MKIGIRVLTTSLCFALALCISCGKEPSPGHGGGGSKPTGGSVTLEMTPFEALNQGPSTINDHASDWSRAVLKMDKRSYQDLGAENNVILPTYSRIRTLKDGSYILGWHNTISSSDANGSDTYYAISKDFKTWTYMGYLWKSYAVTNGLGNPDKRYFTNPNFFQLSNGEVIAVAAFRTTKTYGNANYKNEQGIIVKRSSDGGRSWFGEKEIYHGPCWEAHMIELPSGEIQCFFSESRPWISSSHSGTTMVYSRDGGDTWSPALGQEGLRVMRKHWWNIKPQHASEMWCYTYQMPVGVILNGTSQFAFAMESCNQRVINSSGGTNDQFSIAICFSPEDGQWIPLKGDEVVPKKLRIDSLVTRGAAPYLVQFPSGETVLAYGGTDSKQHIKLGNAKATEFADDVIFLPGKGSWGGLDMSTPHTVLTAMRNSTAGHDNATIAIAKLYLNHGITASSHPVKNDADNSEWTTADDALFVGSRSQAQATLRCSVDKDNYHFLVEVLDRTLSKSDFTYMLLAPDDGTGKLGAKARRIRFGFEGVKSTDQYAGGWKEFDFGAKVTAAYDGTPGDNSDEDNGYLAEITVPRSAIDASSGRILVNLGCFDTVDNVEDVIADANSPSKWMTIKIN